MRSLTKVVSSLVLTGFLAATLIGCGTMPTAPDAPQSVAAASPARTAQPHELISGLVGGLRLIVRTLNLVGSIGGSLTNARWRVVIPPGAVDGNATVALGVERSTSPDCQLEIWPADKNSFRVPVTLSADCRYVSNDQLRNYVIYWYNPASRQWVEVEGSQVNLTTKTVSAPLLHFSQYAVGPRGGRAGW